MASIELKSQNIKRNQWKEKFAEHSFFGCACFAVFSLLLITGYIFYKGLPAIIKIGFIDFVFGTEWKPSEEVFGVFPMIVASFTGTFGATILGVLIGIFTAIFLAELAPNKLAKIFRSSIEILAGIPSVVYGFFGLIVIVPMIDRTLGGGGNSILAVIIILTMMILPTIISISETSLRAVPREYKEGSLAFGATHIQTIYKVLIPAAKSGILTSVVLGMGRAIGETMAVILVAGNSPLIPTSITSRVRTLTANVALEMGYASGIHQEALFATGVVLFVFIMGLNVSLNVLIYRKEVKA